jgi:hypothetical protein
MPALPSVRPGGLCVLRPGSLWVSRVIALGLIGATFLGLIVLRIVTMAMLGGVTNVATKLHTQACTRDIATCIAIQRAVSAEALHADAARRAS